MGADMHGRATAERHEQCQRDLAQARAEAEANMKGNLMWFNEAKKAHGEAERLKQALLHAHYRSHVHAPDSCDGCGDVEGLIGETD